MVSPTNPFVLGCGAHVVPGEGWALRGLDVASLAGFMEDESVEGGGGGAVMVVVGAGVCVDVAVVVEVEGEFLGVGGVDGRCCDEVMAVDQDECL